MIMWIFYTIVVGVSVILALITAVMALRAGLSLWRTQNEVQENLVPDVELLSRRTQILQKNLDELNREASELPIRIQSLQRHLALLQLLTGTLNSSLKELRRALGYTDLKNFGATNLSNAIDTFIYSRRKR